MCIIDKIFSILTISVVKIYKFFISPLLGNNCRFLPTCSEYCIEALEKKGFFVGIFLTFKRILKCHPIKILGGGSGFDPAPNHRKKGK